MAAREDPVACTTTGQLWNWTPPPGVPPIEELMQVHTQRVLVRPVPGVSQLLVCHDFKGDFPPCDSWDGCNVAQCAPFLITHWLHMDTFCYYGSKMVTIPPPAYTSLAHKHGVKVMGTLRFSGGQGLRNLLDILATDQSRQDASDQLLRILKTWRFDGWLVKVEVPLKGAQVDDLLDFLDLLVREAMGYDQPTEVLWFDGMRLDNGRPESQNTLNNRNRGFYNLCDGIFINYAWTLADLPACLVNRGAHTVYMGIDVSGMGGGLWSGWNTHQAMSTIKNLSKSHTLSVALFAPGWVVEAPQNQPNNPEVDSMRFWQSLDLTKTRPLSHLPILTRFRNGYTQNGTRFCLRDMDLMPALALSNDALMPSEVGLRIMKTGKHVLWKVKGIESNRDFRVKIRVEGPGTVAIFLDHLQMRKAIRPVDQYGTIELYPARKDCVLIKRICLVASQPGPGTYLTYFEAYSVETSRCLENVFEDV